MSGVISEQVVPLIQGNMDSFDDWVKTYEKVQARLGEVRAAFVCYQYANGVVLNYGESRYGEACSQYLLETVDPSTLRKQRWVAKNVSLPIADEYIDLTFGHLDAVANLEEEEQKKFLDAAREDGLSVSKLREKIKYPDGKPEPEEEMTPRERLESLRVLATSCRNEWNAWQEMPPDQNEFPEGLMNAMDTLIKACGGPG
jgi:hypothetical protein